MKKISIFSFYDSHKNNIIFNEKSKLNRDGILAPYIKLKNILNDNGYEIATPDIIKIDESDIVIFLRIELCAIIRCLIKRKKCIYIQFEPPVISPIHSTQNMKKIAGMFDAILTWNDDLVDNIHFFKFYYPYHMSNVSKHIQCNDILCKDRKKLTNICAKKTSNIKNELYSERLKAIEYFDIHYREKFDLYGYGWSKSDFISYKGEAKNKIETLKKYKFALCYENEYNLNGLISEKIFDCFFAGTIPIYLGAENIYQYIPSDCFIDKRKYNTYEQILELIENFDENEYQMMLNKIELYLSSEKFARFSSDNFADTIFQRLKILDNGKKNYAGTVKSIINTILLLIFTKFRL